MLLWSRFPQLYSLGIRTYWASSQKVGLGKTCVTKSLIIVKKSSSDVGQFVVCFETSVLSYHPPYVCVYIWEVTASRMSKGCATQTRSSPKKAAHKGHSFLWLFRSFENMPNCVIIFLHVRTTLSQCFTHMWCSPCTFDAYRGESEKTSATVYCRSIRFIDL